MIVCDVCGRDIPNSNEWLARIPDEGTKAFCIRCYRIYTNRKKELQAEIEKMAFYDTKLIINAITIKRGFENETNT